MKLWFIEPKPHVFVSGVKDSVARDVVNYLYDNCPISSNIIIIESISKAPYYKIRKKGVKTDRIGTICGLPVIFYIFSEA